MKHTDIAFAPAWTFLGWKLAWTFPSNRHGPGRRIMDEATTRRLHNEPVDVWMSAGPGFRKRKNR